MRTLLIIKSSLFSGSGQSSALADDYIHAWRERHPNGQVVERNLALEPVPHLDEIAFSGFLAKADERTEAQRLAVARSDALINELQNADVVVLALPMYNFSVPSSFKAWMDHVARAGVTFKYTETGPVGLLEDRPVVVISTRGGHHVGTPTDTQTGLVQNYLGLLGLKSVEFVYAEGLAMGSELAEEARQAARGQLLKLASVAADQKAA